MTPDLSRPAENPLQIITDDDHVVAIVKPAGLPTANAAKGSRSVFTILRQALPRGSFLGVVSRLDAPVSGVLVVAKTRGAAADLARQFRERLVEKTYHALVEGRFPAPLGVWVDWIDRLERQGQERRSRLIPGPGGTPRGSGGRPPQRASSNSARGDQHDQHHQPDRNHLNDWEEGGDEEAWDFPPRGPAAEDGRGGECLLRARVLKRQGELSLVELVPSTGRRHQLRAQLSGRGCPIAGDRTYGARLPFPSLPGCGAAIALHASRLGFIHPGTGKPITLEAGWPAPWTARFKGLQRSLGETGPRKDF